MGDVAEDAEVTLTSVVVTTDSKISSSGQGFWVQDIGGGAYSGVRVYVYDTTDLGIVEGTVLNVTGTVVEYYDLTQIQLDSVSGLELTGDTAATTVDTLDAASVVDWEAWEGCLIEVTDVVVGEEYEDFGEYSIDAGGLEGTLRLDDMIWGEMEDAIDTMDVIDAVTGLLHYSYDVWKIQPRSSADFVGLAAYVPPADECLADKCMVDVVVGDLVITEIMFNPAAGSDSRNEWVEIYNASGGSVNLKGIIVAEGGGGSADFSDDGIVEAGEYAVLAVSDGTDWAYDFVPTGHYGSLAFGNGGDEISIEFDGTMLDWAPDYDPIGASAGVSVTLDPSMETSELNDDIANWCASTEAIAGASDMGTPMTTGTDCD
jgi:hypothetical protein